MPVLKRAGIFLLTYREASNYDLPTMTYHSSTTIEDDRIRITATGSYSYEQMYQFIEHCRTEADLSGCEKVLIDCVTLQMQISEVERFEGGQMFASLFGSEKKVALVLPVGQVTKMGELAANNRGARLLVTESIDEAIGWLND
jgi:hypothetical protein